MIRRLIALTLLAIATSASAQTKIVLGYTPANAFMPAFVAKDQGFFAVPATSLVATVLCESAIDAISCHALHPESRCLSNAHPA